MEANPAEIKARLRQEMRRRLQSVSAAERAAGSAQLAANLLQSDMWRNSRALLLYAPLPDEPDLWPVLEAALARNKIVCLPWHCPRTDQYLARRVTNLETDVCRGYHGIREPLPKCEIIPLNQLDLALVPGLGFSRAGVRLGRGKGYYDRLLARFPGRKCGVAWEWQVDLPIPGESHDVRLNCILTPARRLEV